ncbi:hypothetical protein [Dictyobacter halimunensis]|uniref:hypothetical protein n=1 Tax=Dictyobacter halimunensis TaxID=3026934 RepID=UPI0030C726AE
MRYTNAAPALLILAQVLHPCAITTRDTATLTAVQTGVCTRIGGHGKLATLSC